MKNLLMKLILFILFIPIIILLPVKIIPENKIPKNKPEYFPKPVKYSDWKPAQATYIPAPDFLSFTIDADTGFKVWRLGGSAEEMGKALKHPNGNANITLTHAQHYYSQTDPSNSNETYALSSAGRYKPFAALWRLKDKKLVAWVPSPNPESDIAQRQLLWDRNDINIYWYCMANQLIKVELDLKKYTSKSTIWDTFPQFENITFGLGSGNFSDDGSKIVLVGKPIDHKTSDDKIILSYMVNTKNIIATKKIKEVNGITLDWAGVDPTGNYIVFDDPSKENSTWVLPFDLKGAPRMLYKNTKHSDFVIDNNHKSWIIFGNWQGVFASKLATAKLKRIWPRSNTLDIEKYDGSQFTLPSGESASGHISRVSSRNGFILLSRNEDGGLYFININQPEKSLYIGNTRHGKRPINHPLSKTAWGVDSHGEIVSSDGGKDYYREPRATASSSGKYIFFVSDYHYYGIEYNSNPTPKSYLNMIELNLKP